jgi:hypothetical protein
MKINWVDFVQKCVFLFMLLYVVSVVVAGLDNKADTGVVQTHSEEPTHWMPLPEPPK